MRVGMNFTSRFKVIWVVQSWRKKYSAGPVGQIRFTTSAILSHQGALAIVANEGQGAMDAKAAKTNAAVAYGEIVWVRRPGAGVKSAEAKAEADDGGKKAGHQDDYV